MDLFNIGLQYKRVVVEFLHYDVELPESSKTG